MLGGTITLQREYANKKGDLMQPCSYHDDIGLVTEHVIVELHIEKL